MIYRPRAVCRASSRAGAGASFLVRFGIVQNNIVESNLTYCIDRQMDRGKQQRPAPIGAEVWRMTLPPLRMIGPGYVKLREPAPDRGRLDGLLVVMFRL